MVKSAQGTIEEPGVNVAQKRGLNRAIQSKRWGAIAQRTIDKAPRHTSHVVKCRPHYSSQECPECHFVDSESRVTRSLFICTNCGYAGHADTGAAEIVLGRCKDEVVKAGGIEQLEQERSQQLREQHLQLERRRNRRKAKALKRSQDNQKKTSASKVVQQNLKSEAEITGLVGDLAEGTSATACLGANNPESLSYGRTAVESLSLDRTRKQEKEKVTGLGANRVLSERKQPLPEHRRRLEKASSA